MCESCKRFYQATRLGCALISDSADLTTGRIYQYDNTISQMLPKTLKQFAQEMYELAKRYRIIGERERKRKLYPEEQLTNFQWMLMLVHPYVSYTDTLSIGPYDV